MRGVAGARGHAPFRALFLSLFLSRFSLPSRDPAILPLVATPYAIPEAHSAVKGFTKFIVRQFACQSRGETRRSRTRQLRCRPSVCLYYSGYAAPPRRHFQCDGIRGKIRPLCARARATPRTARQLFIRRARCLAFGLRYCP